MMFVATRNGTKPSDGASTVLARRVGRTVTTVVRDTVNTNVNVRNNEGGSVMKALFEIAMRALLVIFLLWFITLQFQGLRLP
jgi:hypothetical protein